VQTEEVVAGVYLITLWTHGGRRVFAESGVAALFCRILRGLRGRLGFRLHAFVVLPDRVRLIVATGDPDPRSARLIAQRLKSRFARVVNAGSGRWGRVWQDGEQRVGLASSQEIARRADFLHRNPMMARLVSRPGEWRWSSYRAWAGDGAAPIPVDLPGDRGPRLT
jgi:putative transposase